MERDVTEVSFSSVVLALLALIPVDGVAAAPKNIRPPEVELEYMKCIMRIEGEDSFVMLQLSRPSQSRSCLEHRSDAARGDWTMRGMIVLGALLDAYWGNVGEYPRTDRIEDVVLAIGGFTSIELIERDGWGTRIRYRVTKDARYYELSSAGADGTSEGLFWGPPSSDESRPTRWIRDFRSDIVLHGLGWLQAPEYYPPGESGCEGGHI